MSPSQAGWRGARPPAPRVLPLTLPGLAEEAREGAAEPGTGLGGKAACSAGGQSRALAPGRQPSPTVEKIPGTKEPSRHDWPPLLVPGAPQLTNLTSGPDQVGSLHGLRRLRRGLHARPRTLSWLPWGWASQRKALISPHPAWVLGPLPPRGSAGLPEPPVPAALRLGVQSRWFRSSRAWNPHCQEVHLVAMACQRSRLCVCEE